MESRRGMMMFDLKDLIDYYYERERYAWLEYHCECVAAELEGLAEAEKKAIRRREHRDILKYCELMQNSGITPREAEKMVWPESAKFYEYCEKIRKQIEKQKEEKPKEIPKPVQEKKIIHHYNRLYLEKELSQKEKDRLLARGYSRLKISPFGDSGAAYYWVRRRYNESKEHAFFCYILEMELKKYVQKVKLNVNNGPDAVVEYEGKKYCFDVETGKSLSRHQKFLKKKFDYYKKEFAQSYILVTKKSLKFKYMKYGTVITRGKLKKTIAKIFKR